MFNRSTNKLQRPGEALTQQPVAARTDRLQLYDQYGSVAYGIILQILPQPHLAQEVLVDLFASPELTANQSQSTGAALSIVRLARAKALASKEKLDGPTSAVGKGTVTTTADLPKLIFDLSFCQGCTPEQIAEQLQIEKSDVLTAIHTYFKTFRQA